MSTAAVQGSFFARVQCGFHHTSGSASGPTPRNTIRTPDGLKYHFALGCLLPSRGGGAPATPLRNSLLTLNGGVLDLFGAVGAAFHSPFVS